jgi:putative restriction endonuclease
MRGFIANTHHDWFDFLSKKSYWEEVNFWNPSDFYSFLGEPGSPFFFRLKAPRNAIGGFGIVSRFEKLPEWLAWECFESGNGASSFNEFADRLQSLRMMNKIVSRSETPQIGCIILSSVVFFPEHLWIEQPSDWGRQNMRYKGYDLTQGEGLRIWKSCMNITRMNAYKEIVFSTEAMERDRYGEPILITPRMGQGTFRLAVTSAYERACAVTNEHSLPVLEAAHIKPYASGGEHAVRNGILLRSDLHRLFDRGYMTVTPELHIEISAKLRQDYANGRTYYPLHGQSIAVPQSSTDRPDRDLLRWHNDSVFKAA